MICSFCNDKAKKRSDETVAHIRELKNLNTNNLVLSPGKLERRSAEVGLDLTDDFVRSYLDKWIAHCNQFNSPLTKTLTDKSLEAFVSEAGRQSPAEEFFVASLPTELGPNFSVEYEEYTVIEGVDKTDCRITHIPSGFIFHVYHTHKGEDGGAQTRNTVNKNQIISQGFLEFNQPNEICLICIDGRVSKPQIEKVEMMAHEHCAVTTFYNLRETLEHIVEKSKQQSRVRSVLHNQG